MKYRALICLAALGTCGCGAEAEDLEVSRLAVDIADGAQFKALLTENPYGSFTLKADIDMGGQPLHVNAFYGVLDGGGRTIKNVRQVLSSSSGQAGIFGELRGTVKNLKLVDVNFRAQRAGGLASSCLGASVQSVSVKGTIEAGGNAGAICGAASGGQITGSSASGSVKSTGGNAGGLVGSSSIGRSSLGPAVSSSSVSSMTVTGIVTAGGLMGYCQDAVIYRAAVDANVSARGPAGGLCGELYGGDVSYSYAKGANVGSTAGPAGGLVGKGGRGLLTEFTGQMKIASCYAQYANINATQEAGGILGTGLEPLLNNIYAVGNVAGTGAVGGLVGRITSEGSGWSFMNGVYRGIVNDTTRSWAGVIGAAAFDPNANPKWEMTLFDSSLDAGPYFDNRGQRPATTSALRSPTVSDGGVYCFAVSGSSRCGDGAFPSDDWNANGSTQHHSLVGMPGPNPQPI